MTSIREDDPPMGWQVDALNELETVLRLDEAVQSAVLFGSCASGLETADPCSDIDVLVTVADDAFETVQAHRWSFAVLGPGLAILDQPGDGRRVTRVIDSQGRALDFVIIRASDVQNECRPQDRQQAKVLFAPDGTASSSLLAQLPSPAAPSKKYDENHAARVRFLAREAAAKARRGDVIIGLHLALQVAAEVCVQLMAQRDNEHATTHHPSGREGDDARLGPLRELGFATTGHQIVALAAALDALYVSLKQDPPRPGAR